MFVPYYIIGGGTWADNEYTVQYKERAILNVKLSVFLIYVIDGDG